MCIHYIISWQVEKIKLPSESRDNPVEEILFYRKPKGDSSPIETLTREEVQEMVSCLSLF